jgi:hypothetical protein
VTEAYDGQGQEKAPPEPVSELGGVIIMPAMPAHVPYVTGAVTGAALLAWWSA